MNLRSKFLNIIMQRVQRIMTLKMILT